jgi:hypothetical protein
LRLEDDLRAANGCPSDRFRISPAFVADRNAESRTRDVEHLTFSIRHVVFGFTTRRDLILGLMPDDPA